MTRPNVLLRSLSVAAIVAFMLVSGFSSLRANASSHVAQPAQASFTIKIQPPHVPGAAAIRKKYGGQQITFYGSSVGSGSIMDAAAAKRFTQDTGVKVKDVPEPQSTTDLFSALQRFFSGHSSAIDDVMIDVIYPGTFAPYLVDLKSAASANTKLDYASIVKNDTIGGHLVAIPYFADFGMLYYRSDLLRKYHLSVPTTWQQLTNDAKKIQAGEQKHNKNFHGFVFQGNSYEGLTCDALEWIASYGGGTIVNHSGQVTVNNAKAAAALKLAQSWVGTIAPRGVTSYEEEDARNAFDAGDAAFMRNWPYAYSLSAASSSKVAGKFGVAPLPHGPGGVSSAAVGGWQMAVNKYSKHIPAAIEFAKYMTDKQMEAWHAEVGSLVPAMPSVGAIPAVKKVEPFLVTVGDHTNHVTRPSAGLGPKYNQGSTIFFQGVSQILNGQSVSSQLQAMQQQLQNLTH